MDTNKRLLFLNLGPNYPAQDLVVTEKFGLLSSYFSGDILAIIKHKELRGLNYEKFTLRGCYLPPRLRYMNMVRYIIGAPYAVASSIWGHFVRRKYDVIISFDPLIAGSLAIVIGKVTGAKVVIEVNGNYAASFIPEAGKGNRLENFKRRIARWLMRFTLEGADAIRVLYDGQLDTFREIRESVESKKIRFHDFTPISHYSPEKPENYILFLGAPWRLKGVDILINAFQKISHEFPEYALKIVGHCPDKTFYRKLAGENPKIELCEPVAPAQAMLLMQKCKMFVLPSRTEAMGKVLLEAMACRKPIVASDVDGIPTYVTHEYNGLLFEKENSDDLAEKMKQLLSNPDHAEFLAQRGYEYVHENLSEQRYLSHFVSMVETLSCPGEPQCGEGRRVLP